MTACRGFWASACFGHIERYYQIPPRAPGLMRAISVRERTRKGLARFVMRYTLHVNGRDHMVDVDSDTPLLWVLRDAVNLKGTKFGCGEGLCGACNVHLDGKVVRSCMTAISEVGNAKVTTIEGIGETPVGARVQRAWLDIDVVQCGYCQTGQIMSAAALLTQTKTPTDQDIESAMNGNICRCGTYNRIRAAIKQAANSDFGAAAGRKGA
jgi:isoquinoline 1-oxidoreductase alpha subunit